MNICHICNRYVHENKLNGNRQVFARHTTTSNNNEECVGSRKTLSETLKIKQDEEAYYAHGNKFFTEDGKTS